MCNKIPSMRRICLLFVLLLASAVGETDDVQAHYLRSLDEDPTTNTTDAPTVSPVDDAPTTDITANVTGSSVETAEGFTEPTENVTLAPGEATNVTATTLAPDDAEATVAPGNNSANDTAVNASTESPTASPVAAEPTAPTGDDATTESPTVSPVANNEKQPTEPDTTTESPTVSPVASNQEQPTTPATTESPTASPVSNQEPPTGLDTTTESPTASPISNEPPTEEGPIVDEGDCGDALSCLDCQDKALELFDDTSHDTCAWVIGTSDKIVCQKVSKESVVDRQGDQCETPATGDSPTNPPMAPPTGGDVPTIPVVDDDPEESQFGAIFGLVFLLGLGYAAYRFKDRILAQLNGPNGAPGMMGGPTPKQKYREVAMDDELEDDDWGWGDDGDSGDVELATSSRDDSSVKRRTPSTERDSVASQMGVPSASPNSYRHASGFKGHGSNVESAPRIPKPATTTSSGMSLKPAKIASKGMSLTSPSPATRQTSSSSRQTSGSGMPFTAPTPATPPSQPASGNFGGMPGLQITSLGPKRQRAPAPAKKPVAKQEDDIFASMGLSAAPSFSAAPAPKPAATLTSLSGSRWAAPTPSTSAPVPAPASSTFAANALDADDDWDDDGDLDDLLDD